MKKVNIILLILIELCCTCCHFENLHNNHKLIKISDDESLEKENISLQSTINELNEISKKTTELKEKIEKEINKINKLYEKTKDELTKSYINKNEEFLREENDSKEKLQNEIKKVKEGLENYLSELNDKIKLNERINKGIKKMENEEKNMIKFLSYVSKINKIHRKMKYLFTKLIKSLKYNCEEENNIIKYEEYYFNGIPIPKNIEFKNISFSGVDISWNIDNINNIENNKIKYRIEMRKENEIFNIIYEEYNNNYSLNNLKINTNYELRICCLYNNIMGEWTQIQKFKTLDLDSVILNECNRKDEFLNKLYEWCKYKKIELIFRGSRDGMTCIDFHKKCDNKGPTITLIKNEKGNIFGGYASISWTSDNCSYSAAESFLFTLTNIHGIEPTKFPSKKDQNEILYFHSYGPRFGLSDLGIKSDFKEGGWSCFPDTYQDILGKGNSIFTGDLNNNNKDFKLKEIEIFKVYK